MRILTTQCASTAKMVRPVWWKLLMMGLLTATAATDVRADSTWSPANILSVMQHPNTTIVNSRLRTVIAHRGIISDGCPENSFCSIDATYANGIEGIELDVKESSDKSLWLSHDQRLGRQLSYTPEFDIFTTTYDAVNNPDISTVTDVTLSTYGVLRDRAFTVTGQPVRMLEDALTHIRDNVPHMVVVLDLKTRTAVSAAADIVNRNGMASYVVLKTSATVFGLPDQISAITKGVPFVPTIYAQDMVSIIDSGWDGGCSTAGGTGLAINQCRIETWVQNAEDVAGYSWVEIGNKNPVEDDPTFFLLQWAYYNSKPIGGFQPVPEYPDHDGVGASYVRANATCCGKLSDYLKPASAYFSAETVDNRYDLDSLINSGMSAIITDAAVTAAEQLDAKGMRNTQVYSQ